ncbi:hypothetical protein FS749_004237 [Ceratobasidium sp. UAMH 11750]|nr:hypothetical protein FS749_004237 [Ceratobasidium sp. UAMH 11750]
MSIDPTSVPLPNGSTPSTSTAVGVRVTNLPSIKNAPLPAEGNGTFSNATLAGLVLGVPYVVKRVLPIVNRGGSNTYWFLVVVLGVPVAVAYWTVMSMYGARKNEKVAFPGRPQSEYFEIKDAALKAEWAGKKIPMQVFHDAYFEGKIDFKGDVLDVMEYRHDWAAFTMTPELFKYVFTSLIPEVIMHSKSQDEEQVRDHYDRGDDFYEWFLGPRMVYTSGVVMDNTKEESLEQLQDNKLALVCEKLDLKPTDKLLDMGCGWGTLAATLRKTMAATLPVLLWARTSASLATSGSRTTAVIPSARGSCAWTLGTFLRSRARLPKLCRSRWRSMLVFGGTTNTCARSTICSTTMVFSCSRLRGLGSAGSTRILSGVCS